MAGKILSLGQEMPSAYFDSFNPAIGVQSRITVLKSSPIGINYHFISDEVNDIKGAYECINGCCCEAHGAANQVYVFPILSWRNPAQSLDCDLLMWRVPRTVYRQLVDLAQTCDITTYDLIVKKVQQGQGTRTNVSFVPTAPGAPTSLRASLSPERNQEIEDGVSRFYSQAGEYIAHSMTRDDWAALLYKQGYDVNSRRWLTSPMAQQPKQVQQSIRQGIAAPQQTYSTQQVYQPQSQVVSQQQVPSFGAPSSRQSFANSVQSQPVYNPPAPANEILGEAVDEVTDLDSLLDE